jgi:hypothetical protein
MKGDRLRGDRLGVANAVATRAMAAAGVATLDLHAPSAAFAPHWFGDRTFCELYEWF